MRKSLIAVALLGVFSQISYAEAITVSQNELYENDIVAQDATTTLNNQGTIENDQIVLKGGSFDNEGEIVTGTLDILTSNSGSPIFKGSITATEAIIYRGTKSSNSYTVSLDSLVETPLLQLVGSTNETGLVVRKQNTIDGVQTLWIETSSAKTGIVIDAEGIQLPEDVYLKNAGLANPNARVEVYDGASVQMKNVYSLAGKTMIQVNGQSSASVENIQLEANSILNLQTNASGGSADDIGTIHIKNLVLGQDSFIRASVYGTSPDAENPYSRNQPALSITGEDVVITLAEGSGVDFGGYNSADNHDWRPEDIEFNAKSVTINVQDSSSGNFVYFSGVEGKLLTDPSNIRVIAASSNNTGDPEADLQKLADVVLTNTKEGEEKQNTLHCLPGVIVEQEATDILDGAIGEVSGDCPSCTIGNVRLTANPNIHGIAEMAALGLHVWRNEIDDMHRRVGELRDNAAQSNGLWTRVYHGKAEYGAQDVTNRYTAFQFGYDRQVGDGFWLGVAFSYTDGNNDFNYGDGDSNLYAFSGYGSWLWDNGLYLDVVGKVGRMKNSFDINFNGYDSTGSYHTNAASLSAEAGWRYYATEQIYIEPQVQMWYGHVMDADYRTSTGINVENDSVDSLVGRAGIKMGFKDSEGRGGVFLKASVLHDWKGDADFRFGNAEGVTRQLTESLGGTWYEYGLGADFNATQQVRIYADIEAANGGEVDTDYRFNLGVRYAW